MPKKETFTSRLEETRGGRVPQKSKIWGDVVYGWSLSQKRFFSTPENASFQGYIAEVSFETLEENQLSYVQNGYFDKIL